MFIKETVMDRWKKEGRKKRERSGTRFFFRKRLFRRARGLMKNEKQSVAWLRGLSFFLLAVLALGLCGYIWGVLSLKSGPMPGRAAGYLLGLALCVLICVFSTSFSYFGYWERRKKGMLLAAGYTVMLLVTILSDLYCRTMLPIIFLMPISRDITKGMVVNLARLVYFICTAFPGGVASYHLYMALFQEENKERIMAFKLRKVLDLREDKEFCYDLKIVRRLDTGRLYTIKERDRQRHMLLNGVTGTGKTSSGLLPSVASDLDRKAHNEDYVKKALLSRMLTCGDVHPKKGMTDETFSMDAFWAEGEEGRGFLRELGEKAPSAGITVVAPNADFADAVYEMAVSRGFAVNRVDPIPLDVATGEMKPGFVGFNPLYISPGLSPSQRRLEVFRKARMFSDVLQALYEQSGKSDPYFTSLNRNLTTMLSILILLTYPWLHEGEQPDPTSVQEVINDFSCVRVYIYALAKIAGIGDELRTDYDVTPEWIRGKKFGEYQFIITQLAYDLMGAGRTKMEEQARGLRVIINEFLTDPQIRYVLCAKNTVDIDRALKRGEITVVNYALELGMSIATGFGLFYCLSFNQAVLRRPGTERTRLIHFYYCDEFPVLLHKDMEPIFTLFRQFKVCFTCAFQTTSQFDRNDMTKYLKNVVLSNVGHHILYGNLSAEDAKLYEALAGKKLELMEQKTRSEKPLLNPDASTSFSVRTTPQFVNRMEGYMLRNRDFQEVTVFGVNEGDYVEPFAGRLSFLTKRQKEGENRCHVDWSRFLHGEEEEDASFTESFINLDYFGYDIEGMLKEAGLDHFGKKAEEKTAETDVQVPFPSEETEMDLSSYYRD